MIYLFIYLFVCLFVCLFVYLFVNLFMYVVLLFFCIEKRIILYEFHSITIKISFILGLWDKSKKEKLFEILRRSARYTIRNGYRWDDSSWGNYEKLIIILIYFFDQKAFGDDFLIFSSKKNSWKNPMDWNFCLFFIPKFLCISILIFLSKSW